MKESFTGEDWLINDEVYTDQTVFLSCLKPDRYDRLEARRIVTGEEWKHWRRYFSAELCLTLYMDRWN